MRSTDHGISHNNTQGLWPLCRKHPQHHAHASYHCDEYRKTGVATRRLTCAGASLTSAAKIKVHPAVSIRGCQCTASDARRRDVSHCHGGRRESRRARRRGLLQGVFRKEDKRKSWRWHGNSAGVGGLVTVNGLYSLIALKSSVRSELAAKCLWTFPSAYHRQARRGQLTCPAHVTLNFSPTEGAERYLHGTKP